MNWRHLRIFSKGVLNTASVGIGKELSGSIRLGWNIRVKSGSVSQREGRSELVDFTPLAGTVDIERLWEVALEGKVGGVWTFWYGYTFSSGAILRYHDMSDDSTIQITNTLSNPNIWCLNIFDHQFVSNGEDALYCHAGGPSTWIPVGLAKPATAPTAITPVGVLNNWKGYKYTYARSTDIAGTPYVMESNASDVEKVDMSAGTLSATITMVPSGEAHAEHYNLYATPLGTEAEVDAFIAADTFYRISHQLISGGNTHNDNVATPVVVTYDTTDRGVPPVCAQMLWHDNRLYLIGDPDNKSIVYYSEIGKPFYFPADNWDEVARDDGDQLTGLANIGPTRYLFKTHSIYSWTGDPTLITPIRAVQSSQTQNQSSLGVGCRDSLSIAQGADFVVFRAADDHVYIITQTALVKLSEGQETDVEMLAEDATGAIWNDYYILNSNSVTLVWHLPTKAYMGKDTGVTTNKFLIDHNDDLVYGNGEFIYQLYVGTQDDGEDFTKSVQTPYLRLAEDEEEATVRRIVVTTSERDCDFTVYVYDETETQIDTGTYALTDRHYSCPRGVRGQYISVRISWTGTATIESVGIGFLKRGRRH